jgi:hypothetical protein
MAEIYIQTDLEITSPLTRQICISKIQKYRVAGQIRLIKVLCLFRKLTVIEFAVPRSIMM